MILHFWLAYDHPFVDGNGRTARALFYWSMRRSGYWLIEFISISQAILQAPKKYYRAFLYTETDGNDLTYFLIHQLDVVSGAIADLSDHLEQRSKRARDLEAQFQSMSVLNHRQRNLLSHALRHPGFDYSIKSHQTSHSVVYQTARADLDDLVVRGFLEKRKIGKSLKFFPAPQLEGRLKAPGGRTKGRSD